jgi:hypothetical protein
MILHGKVTRGKAKSLGADCALAQQKVGIVFELSKHLHLK